MEAEANDGANNEAEEAVVDNSEATKRAKVTVEDETEFKGK